MGAGDLPSSSCSKHDRPRSAQSACAMEANLHRCIWICHAGAGGWLRPVRRGCCGLSGGLCCHTETGVRAVNIRRCCDQSTEHNPQSRGPNTGLIDSISPSGSEHQQSTELINTTCHSAQPDDDSCPSSRSQHSSCWPIRAQHHSYCPIRTQYCSSEQPITNQHHACHYSHHPETVSDENIS